MNIKGTEVFAEKLENTCQIGDRSLDISELPSGVYFVNVQADGYSQSKKLVLAK